MLVLALFASEMGIRIAREARVTRIQLNAETANRVAEAGLNRVRAAIVNQSNKLDNTHPNICGLNAQEVFTLTYTDTGETAGTYTLDVACNAGSSYVVTATGTVGSGAGAAKSVVRATIVVNSTNTRTVNGRTYYVASTTYTP